MIRILHIIPDTDTGGAEMMLFKLLAAADGGRFSHEVISMLPVQEVGERIARLGIPVHTLSMRPGIPRPGDLFRLRSLILRLRPDVIQSWMYHADLAAAAARMLSRRIPLAWNIRQTNLSPAVNSPSTLRSARLCARLSGRVPEAVVCCSEAARKSHIAFGYSSSPMLVIPNGFDLSRFAPDPTARAQFRSEIGAGEGDFVIGLVARLDRQKDHGTFFAAARALSERVEKGRSAGEALKTPLFVLVGEDMEWSNPLLSGMIGDTPDGLFGGRIRLLGRRRDLEAVYPGFDLSGTSSLGEGFPNVVGEAMASAVPCVVTDVGDSALLVGDTGTVVPPGNPESLARAWFEWLRMAEDGRRTAAALARKRIAGEYSIDRIARSYEALWERLA